MALDFEPIRGSQIDTIALDQKDSQGNITQKHVADVIIVNHDILNFTTSQVLYSSIKTVLQTGKPAPMNVGMISQYSKSSDTLALRFIDPKNPKISETMVTVIMRDKATFDDETIKNLMASFTLSDNEVPKFDKKNPKLTP